MSRQFSILVWICAIATSGLLTALAGLALFSFIVHTTKSFPAAIVAAFTYALGTPTWGWATTLLGHAVAGALLILAFIAVEKSLAQSRVRATRAAFVGVLLGAAITTEFTAAVPAAIITSHLAAFVLHTRGLKAAGGSLLCTGLGAASALLPLFWYNFSAFGSPLALGYSNVVGFDGMQTGFFGIAVPKLDVLFAILFGFYRGLLWISPISFVAIYATVANIVAHRQRTCNAVVMTIVFYYLLVNSGYAYWDGGESIGPRHITPMFPFLAVALGIWFASARRGTRVLILGVLIVSIIMNLVCASASMLAPERFAYPLTEYIWPILVRGELRPTIFYRFWGIPGWQELPVLAGVWLVLGAILWRNAMATRGRNCSPQL